MVKNQKTDSFISKDLLNFILELYENAEMFDKMEVLLGLLEHEKDNEDIANMLEELGYCRCGGDLTIKQFAETNEFWGSKEQQTVSYYKCENCGLTNQ